VNDLRPRISFRHQSRKSLALKVTPQGIEVLVPSGLSVGDPEVQAFLDEGLARLPHPTPVPPAERTTRDRLDSLVSEWSDRLQVQISRVQLRAMSSKWASVSSAGTLTLSKDLVGLPLDLTEYVICHELVHLRIPNHGKGFHAMLGTYIPDWQERERRLAGWTLNPPSSAD